MCVLVYCIVLHFCTVKFCTLKLKPERCPMDMLSVIVGVRGPFSVTCCPYHTIDYESTCARLTLINGSRMCYCMNAGDILIFDAENVPHYGNALEVSALRLHVPYMRVCEQTSNRRNFVDEERSAVAYAATNLHLIQDDYRK